MTKRDALQAAVEAATGQARALRALVASVPASTLPEGAVVNAVGEVMNTLLTVVSPLAVEVENESIIKREVASKPRKTITEAKLIEAMNAHIVACRINGRHAAGNGWKGSIAYHLKMDPRTLRYPPGWDEARILDYLESR